MKNLANNYKEENFLYEYRFHKNQKATHKTNDEKYDRRMKKKSFDNKRKQAIFNKKKIAY